MMAELFVAAEPPLWIDWLLAITMWFCGGVTGYLGAMRINQSHGVFLLLMRALGVAWLAYAGRLTYLLSTEGQLVISWWATLPLLVIAACTMGLGIERVKIGRVSYGRRANDKTSVELL